VTRPTPDGTGVCDDVVDLALGHVIALGKFPERGLSTLDGHRVRDQRSGVVKAFSAGVRSSPDRRRRLLLRSNQRR
jgi:UDP-glucose 4-epimerase